MPSGVRSQPRTLPRLLLACLVGSALWSCQLTNTPLTAKRLTPVKLDSPWPLQFGEIPITSDPASAVKAAEMATDQHHSRAADYKALKASGVVVAAVSPGESADSVESSGGAQHVRVKSGSQAGADGWVSDSFVTKVP